MIGKFMLALIGIAIAVQGVLSFDGDLAGYETDVGRAWVMFGIGAVLAVVGSVMTVRAVRTARFYSAARR
jgi:hypothetical protein